MPKKEETERDIIDYWKDFHRKIVNILDLDYVETKATLRAIKELKSDNLQHEENQNKVVKGIWKTHENQFSELEEKLKQAKEIVSKKLKKKLQKCKIMILAAENSTMACDGPVPKTSNEMATKDLEYCLQVLWEVIETVK